MMLQRWQQRQRSLNLRRLNGEPMPRSPLSCCSDTQ
jgi:hypothetical protein